MLRLDSAMDRSYVVRGTLDHATLLSELERLGPGDVVVDVGANAGLYSVLAARHVAPGGRVFAFEPSADEFARLAWALRANGVDNVVASNTALADRAGFLGFVPAPSQHTGLHRLGADGDAAPQRVWAERGDVAVQLEAKENVALLKIDVEGSELGVLRGFQALLEAGRIGRLVIEISDEFLRRYGASAAELYTYLAALGYVPARGPLGSAQYDEVFARR
jgi:FkbM family methyltransferase